MNIYNRQSRFSESHLDNQFETQSCKLNESESKPNITLKKIGQELDIAETKCSTLKSELNFMMGVCRKAQTEVKGSKETSDISHEQIISLSEDLVSNFPIECRNHHSDSTTVNEISNYKILIQNNEQKTEGNFDTVHLNPKSIQVSPEKSIYDDNVIENFENTDLNGEKQARLLNVTITPRTQLDKKLPSAIMTVPIQNKTMVNKECKDHQSCNPEHMRKYLQSMLNVKESVEELILKADENYFRVIPSSARKGVKNPALSLELDIPDNTEVRHTDKNKLASRIKNRETKTNDTMSKVRKRKGKLCNSVSKSTVTTKNTNFTGRKEIKKRRQKGRSIALQQSTFSKIPKRSNDVVEIFHNTTIKSSNSAVSSKHSKLVPQEKYIKRHVLEKQDILETDNRNVQGRSSFEPIIHECQSHNMTNQQKHCLQPLDYQNNSQITRKQYKLEKHSNEPCPSKLCKAHQCEHTILNEYNEPMLTPSYELPTLASRLKCSNRPYFSRFNFRNIPFVVGTSVTPSHNLGLNIQQVLSTMKTRQLMINDITPSLMRKVSRGVKPMSILLEQMNGQYEKSIFNIKSQMTGISKSKECLDINQGDKKLSTLHFQHVEKVHRPIAYYDDTKKVSEKENGVSAQFCEEKNDSYKNHKIKEQRTASSAFMNKSSTPVNARNPEGISRTSLNMKDIISDYKIHIPVLHNSKEIRDVFINLHDQFKEMNTKHEKLQSEVEKSNDKSLAKELSIMEKELNIKEEEINAIISLYKEVLMLKQQVKMMHEKNSLVCITTRSPMDLYKNSFPLSVIAGKSRPMSQVFSQRRENAYGVAREPPTSIQLAALLRRIQTFHKQLQLVS